MTAIDDAPSAGDAGRRQHARWIVHVALMGTFAAALVALLTNRSSIGVHIVLGLSFTAMVMVHLVQRQRTVRRLVASFFHASMWLRPRGRMAFSDLLLAFVVGNVLVSGVVDYIDGYNTGIPLHDLGLPEPYISWHTLSSVVLLAYLLVHVIRRRGRLVHSRVR